MKKNLRSYTKASEKEKVRSELKDTKPVVVRFYRESCPACQMSSASWKLFCSKMKGSSYTCVEIEEEAIPEELLQNITAFPTYAKHDKNGNKKVVGVQEDLVRALHLID